MEGPCLGCSDEITYDEPCPNCGWDPTEFRARGRHNLATEGHGEPESEDTEGDRGGRGPPPGPDGLIGF